MKRIFHYAALALAVGLGACSEDDAPAMQEQELSIAARSTDDVEGATETFTRPFTLTLWSTTDAAKHETHSMTYTDGTGWNTVKSSVLPATAFAYCGEGVSNVTSSTSYTVTLLTDQSDAPKLADADVMIATGEASTGIFLDLNFLHYYAKVTFNATLAEEFDDTDKITSLEVMTVDDKTVNTYVNGETVSAIITSGEYTEGNNFLSITVSDPDNPLTVKVPAGGLTFTAGTHYTFDLKVGKDKVTLTLVSTSTDFPGGWNDEENLN